ncbi:MAG: hypothetical protein KJ052_20720 [Candidatus Hydrogenedentes bacterium]|nr:hypothetical protein [Candidatus Hydrogenedentota bacterium]
MKHIGRVSKPMFAAAAGPLTNFGKPTGGLFGVNEVNDFPVIISTLAQGTFGFLGQIVPTGVVKSSGQIPS